MFSECEQLMFAFSQSMGLNRAESILTFEMRAVSAAFAQVLYTQALPLLEYQVCGMQVRAGFPDRD